MIIEHSIRISQTSTNAPTAVQVVNTLVNGVTVAYARPSTAGIYTITYSGLARFGVTAANVLLPATWQAGNATHNQKATFTVAVGVADVVVTITTTEAAVATPNTFVAADAVLSALPVTIAFNL